MKVRETAAIIASVNGDTERRQNGKETNTLFYKLLWTSKYASDSVGRIWIYSIPRNTNRSDT